MGDTSNSQGLTQPTLYRILDANLDRAREGLRIIEEWCRFGLNSAQFTEECKQMRQSLGSWHSEVLRNARNTPDDPGTEITHPQEQHRGSIRQVLQVNFSRIEEALRVLEEYGKLYKPEMAIECKQLRYRSYTLETNLLSYQRQQQVAQSLLYLITSPSERLFTVVEAALRCGLTLVQYRDKDATDQTRLEIGLRLRNLCHQYNALLIVNDRVDLALAVGADGIHLGQQDVPVSFARQVLGPQCLIGRSTHNPDDLHRALQEGVDYIGVGPVYETPTKAGRQPVGLEYIRYAAEHCPIPWFAIGGIDPTNLDTVLTAGAERVSVVRAIMEADETALVTQYFLSQLKRLQTIRAYESRLNNNGKQQPS